MFVKVIAKIINKNGHFTELKIPKDKIHAYDAQKLLRSYTHNLITVYHYDITLLLTTV